MAIKGSKIIAVGKAKDILARWKSEGTEVVDLAGKTLVPGFIESWGQMQPAWACIRSRPRCSRPPRAR